MVIRRVIISRIVNFCTKCLDSIINLSDQCLKLQALLQPSLTNGTSSGAHPAARATCMRVWMNTKKLIISLRVMRSPGRTDCALTWSECKNDLESNILTLSQILTFSLMNSVNSMNTIKNWNSTIAKRTSGSWNLPMPPRAEVSPSLTTSMM